MTGDRVARVLVGLFFVALLAAPVVMKRISAGRDADRSKIDAKTALARHGFYLEEVSHAAGVTSVLNLLPS